MQEEKATTIGESILITGNLSGDEDLTVLGRVEGTISLSRTLYVAESGIVKANVAVDDAVISGVVVGNVTATNSVQITETGRLLGDLRAPRVIIVAGARVRGQVDMSGRAQNHAAYERESSSEARSASRASTTSATASAAASRTAQGRFERLSLPARRPMPQAPQVARPASMGQAAAGNKESAGHHRAEASRPSHTPQVRAKQGPTPGQNEAATVHAPRRPVANHHKKRAAAKRRD